MPPMAARTPLSKRSSCASVTVTVPPRLALFSTLSRKRGEGCVSEHDDARAGASQGPYRCASSTISGNPSSPEALVDTAAVSSAAALPCDAASESPSSSSSPSSVACAPAVALAAPSSFPAPCRRRERPALAADAFSDVDVSSSVVSLWSPWGLPASGIPCSSRAAPARRRSRGWLRFRFGFGTAPSLSPLSAPRALRLFGAALSSSPRVERGFLRGGKSPSISKKGDLRSGSLPSLTAKAAKSPSPPTLSPLSPGFC
mmetsp:Transcript_15795/g.48185  ORF Transcript_15795/g.48185 Transcript_15795/m.48185 type:complete len:258 (-) Transcript_15795:567-1340(-)